MTTNKLTDIKQFTKKPVTISAIQWTGDNLPAVIEFTGKHPRWSDWFADMDEYVAHVRGDGNRFKIFTLEGVMDALPGDWIIRGIHGEHYPCKPDIFSATYEPAELQEHRAAVEDKDLLGVIDALEHPAGINAAGKQVVRRALVELQEIRRSYLALRGEIEDVQSQLYEADNQANEYAAELQERRKADSEREQVRSAHAEWSLATFGDVGPVGPLKHLSKEAMEAAAEPDDHSEWADMQFLLWDAQRRAGISDEQITQAMVEKLAVNKQREWPEPKDGEPRLHIKEQPAPLVPETLPCPVHLEPGLKFGKGVRTQCLMDALRRRADYYAELEAMTPEQRAEHDAGIAEFKAMIGNGGRGDMVDNDPQHAIHTAPTLHADGESAFPQRAMQSFGNSEQLIKHPSRNQGSDSNASAGEIKQPASNAEKL